MRPRRVHRPRTPDSNGHEALGLALGRLCMLFPDLREPVMAGFTRALREKQAGRNHTMRDIADALRDAEQFLRTKKGASCKESKR